MPWTKEDKKAYNKEYAQTPAGIKSNRISRWKRKGIIVEDWDAFYDYFLSITNCQLCQKELTTDRYSTHSTKCVDHDHSINDRPNVRTICCQTCNANDKSTNTSGEPNISYHKINKCWCFKKTIKGKYYCKYGFKTFQEAVDYKISILGKNIFQ